MNAMKRSRIWERVLQAAALISAAVFLFGLAQFAYAGTQVRYWADDYCYSASVKQFGLPQALIDWYRTSGNRLSTLVVVAFSDQFGMQSIHWVSLAVLLVWVGAWIFFLLRLRGLLRWTIAPVWLVLLALVEVYFAALLAPDRLQTIYWRMGTYHYTLPLPLLLINLGLLAGCLRTPCRQQRWLALVSGLLALFAAGLSETFAALQAGVWILGLLAAFGFSRGAQRSSLLRLLAAPLVGTLVMMLIMMLAPANAWRQAVMPPPEQPLLLIPFSLRFSLDFIWYTLRGQVVPFLVYLIGIGTIALLATRAQVVQLSLRAGLLSALGALLAMYALIVCSFAPSAYAALAYPAGRALMPAGFILLFGLGCAAGLAALALRAALPLNRPLFLLAGVGLLLVFSWYPLHVKAVPQQDFARLSTWAVRWDARSAQIMQSVAAGNTDVQVRQIEVVRSLEDIGPDPTQWVNACARMFYNAHSITANP